MLALQAEGLTILYTSELVRPEMRAQADLGTGSPRRRLETLLEPHRLELREVAPKIFVIVGARAGGKDEERPRGGGIVVGRVLAQGADDGVVARVQVLGTDFETTSDALGVFVLRDLPSGPLSLLATAPGFLAQRVGGVKARNRRAPRVLFRLPPEPYLEDEIVVRAGRSTLLSDRPAGLSLDRRELERQPQLGGDVLRTASLLPGVAANDISAQFSVHGGRRDEVAILLDGQELYDAFHLKDYDNALSLIPARILSRADLAAGVFGVDHGDRMGAILDLRTRQPDSRRETLLGASVLDISASTSGLFGGASSDASESKPEGHWFLSGRRGSLDLAGKAIGSGGPSLWDVFGKFEFHLPKGRIAVHLLTAGDALTIDEADETDFEQLSNEYRRDYAWLVHNHSFGSRWLVENRASWTRLETERGGSGSEEQGAHILRDQRDTRILGLSQTWDWQRTPDDLWHWGVDGRSYATDFIYQRDLEPLFVYVSTFSPAGAQDLDIDRRLTSESLGLWFGERRSTDRWTVEWGLRHDSRTTTDEQRSAARFNVARRLGDNGVLRGAVGRYDQSQRPYELQIEEGQAVLQPAERADHAVLGYERVFRGHRWGLEALRVELFARRVGNPRAHYENLFEGINYFPEIEGDRLLIAPEETRASGLEIQLRGRRGDRFSWRASYSHSRATDEIEDRSVPRAFDQPHAFSAVVQMGLPQNWNLDLAWRYHTGWPRTLVDRLELVEAEDPEDDPTLFAYFGDLRTGRLGNYHRLDLRLSRGWNLSRGQFLFFLDVQNAYDRRNVSGFDLSIDDDDTPRVVEDYWPGTVPSFGVQWTF